MKQTLEEYTKHVFGVFVNDFMDGRLEVGWTGWRWEVGGGTEDVRFLVVAGEADEKAPSGQARRGRGERENFVTCKGVRKVKTLYIALANC